MAYQPKFGHLGLVQEYREFERSEHVYASSLPDFLLNQSTPNKAIVDACVAAMPFDEGFGFWLPVEKVFGYQIQPGPQDIGNCVGYADCLSLCDLQGAEIYCCGDMETPFVPYVPFSYGAGRVYIGGGRLGRGDGSLGTWQLKADIEYGYLPSDLPGLTVKPGEPAEPDANTGRDWGSRKSILDQWKAKAEPFKVAAGPSMHCETADIAREMVVDHLRPLTIASDWGFAKDRFDEKYGITLWKKSGSWAHQMHIRGIFSIKGQWFVYVGNQWGLNYHGSVGEGFPRGGFVIPFELFARWTREAFVAARGNFSGRQQVVDVQPYDSSLSTAA